nr:hypothetical protein [Tanacetum cinerariifolium]
MEQYMASTRGNNRSAAVRPEIGNNVDFKIKIQFIKELRLNLFVSTEDENAHEHVQKVLEIIDLFHIIGVTHDTIMLRVFSITLTEAARRWKNMLPAGSINSWDLLEKALIWKYCPPLKTAKKFKEIHNFKQEIDETLYQAWERYNYLLFECLQHDLNNQQKKLKESIHAIHVGCKIYEGVHLTQECPLKKEGKVAKQVKYIGFLEENINKFLEESNKKQAANDEWIRKFRENTDSNLKILDAVIKDLEVKVEKLIQAILTNEYDSINKDDEAQAFRTLDSLKKVKINRPLIRAVKKMLEYLKYMKDGTDSSRKDDHRMISSDKKTRGELVATTREQINEVVLAYGLMENLGHDCSRWQSAPAFDY